MDHSCQSTALDTIPNVKRYKIKGYALETLHLCSFLSWEGGEIGGEREQKRWWVDTKHAVVCGMSGGVSIRVWA